MKKNIPTHDPQTGELNPYYEELTGESNPLMERIHYLYDEQRKIDKLLEYIKKEIIDSSKLSETSNNPSFYLGRIDALLEIRRKILKNDLGI